MALGEYAKAQPDKVVATFWISCATSGKAAARFDSLSPLHHKSPFTTEQTMTPPVTRAKDMTRILQRLTSGRVQ
jgi:hypothetical protein